MQRPLVLERKIELRLELSLELFAILIQPVKKSVVLHSLTYVKQRKNHHFQQKTVVLMVGVAGFEPTASWTRTKRDTKLRHTPISTLLL